MSYTVLARRYRSATFDEVVGQDHVAKTLKRAIESGRIAHAYLFCGTRGVGKTSMARILAKALNCENAKGPTAEPCLKCSSCQAIARGEDMDVIEIDAASNTGVDNIREVIGNAQYRPARSRYKIYIIDEVHMLSKPAFNALLKTLEEPPEHVKFILATTETEKILPTILSRCQRYDFRNIPTREIAEHLKEVCKGEKIEADEDALFLVAKAGAGSMRDAISLLDRLLSLGEKRLTVETIEQLLGLPKTQIIFDLAQAIGEGDAKTALERADKMISDGLAPDSLLSSLSDHLRNLLIIRTCGLSSRLVEVPGLPAGDLEKQARQFDAVALTQDITIIEELRRQLRSTQAGRVLLDATLVRLALADQFSSVADLLAQLGGAPAPAVQKKKLSSEAEPAVARTPTVTPNTTGFPPVIPSGTGVPPVDGAAVAASMKAGQIPDLKSEVSNPESQIPSPLPDPPHPQLETRNRETGTSPPEPGTPPLDPASLWPALLAAMESQGRAMHSVLSLAQLVSIENDQALIRFPPESATFADLWMRNGKRDAIAKAASALLGRDIGVRFDVPEPAVAALAPSPAAAVAPQPSPGSAPPQAAAERPAPPPMPAMPPAGRPTDEQLQAVREDPLIRAVLDELNARVVRIAEEVA